MNGTFLDVLPLAVGIAASPLAIITMLLLLVQRRLRPALWFLAGWTLGLLLLFTIVMFWGDNMPTRDRELVSPYVGYFKVLIGFLLIALGMLSYVRSRRSTAPKELPAVIRSVDKLTPARSAGAAAFMATINVKNVMLLLAFAVAVSAQPRPPLISATAVILFIIIASLALAVPVLYALIRGRDAEMQLQRWQEWLVNNQGVVMAVFIGLVGLNTIVRGLQDLEIL